MGNIKKERMRCIILNRNNIVPDSNNGKFSYRFPTTQKFEDIQLALGNLVYNQSIFNITPANNNTYFSYIWNANASTTHLVDLIANHASGGFFRLADINAYLQYTMFKNNHYLIDASGNIVYYISLTINRVFYGYEISCDPLPAVLPAGWSIPAGATWTLPAVDTTPQLIIPNTNIQTLLGFPVATYPSSSQATTYNLLSPNVPQIYPTSSVLISCSLIDNNLQYPNQVFYSFLNTDQLAGTPVDIRPTEYQFINLQDGYYSGLEIQFLNQNFEPIGFQDPDITMNLLLCYRCTKIASKDSFLSPHNNR